MTTAEVIRNILANGPRSHAEVAAAWPDSIPFPEGKRLSRALKSMRDGGQLLYVEGKYQLDPYHRARAVVGATPRNR